MLQDLGYDDEERILEVLQRDNRPSRNFLDFMNEKGFLEPIENTIDISPGELLLQVLQFSLNSKLSFSALIALLQLVNRICGEKVLPETRYLLNNCLKSDEGVTLYSVCPTCTEYLAEFDDKIKFINCSKCDSSVNVSNPSNPCFFALLDPSNSIREYLQEYEDYYDYVMNVRIHEKDHIKDIYDGKAYRKFVKSLPDSVRSTYVTLVLNTDGAPAFKSFNFSIWPIYVMINEIPLQARFGSLVVVGIWFGKSTPEMSVILERLVEHMNIISIEGVPCRIKQKDCKIKVFVIVACVDTIARAPMNGSCQFNAKYGCDWCEHPGDYFAGSMRYRYLPVPAPARNTNSTIEYARQALESGVPVCGIKSATPLIHLNGFDIIKGFCPDYMHCLLAGVTCQITNNLLGMLSANKIDELDDLLKTIKLPSQLSRLTRGIKDRGYWKCREWENWLLYYSVPLLDVVLNNKKYLEHWSLLVDSTYILLKNDITYTELNDVNDKLRRFVKDVEKLYTLKAMTYNIHQILHIVKSVQDWGSLWAHSAFPFKSANHSLLCAIECARGVVLQINRYLNIQRFVKTLEREIYPNYCDTVTQYCKSVDSARARKIFKSSSITYFGKENIIDQNSLLNFNVSTTTKVFSKIVFKGCLFTSSTKVNQRSCNSFAQLIDGRFVEIIDFLIDTQNKLEVATCHILKTRKNRYSTVIREIVTIPNDVVTVQTTEIATICVFIRTDNFTYIIPVPNLYHY